ncbi:PRC-barrel domain-containing protein [Conexibacter sp. S30A1]|uniref:PRC-barrel domain-containing protein n=1 Tax=Conexibacter sp. S30A1 TaxID=2937800 RepID=UPI00200BB7A3|nr:PRC-barrel domain-containing protein [Conexibacter sp. S30A1]
MSAGPEFIIGSDVTCRDGECGALRRVVVDPVARALTHIVVEPRHHQSAGHLVPIELVESAANEIRLSCTVSEFDALESAEETHFLPGASGEWGYEQHQMLSWPYYGLGGGMGMGMGGMGMGMGGMGMGGMGPHTVTDDRVPAGEVEVRRGEHVHAKDGEIGRVQGLVVDPRDHHVTHFLLDEGHLWGKKRVVIPIGTVTSVKAGVQLSLSKDEVRDLPAVELDHQV